MEGGGGLARRKNNSVAGEKAMPMKLFPLLTHCHVVQEYPHREGRDARGIAIGENVGRGGRRRGEADQRSRSQGGEGMERERVEGWLTKIDAGRVSEGVSPSGNAERMPVSLSSCIAANSIRVAILLPPFCLGSVRHYTHRTHFPPRLSREIGRRPSPFGERHAERLTTLHPALDYCNLRRGPAAHVCV
jgi:hypothetical protein